MSTIGFIGLGNMGLPMARNLLAAGHGVTGFDVVPEAPEAARANGVEIAARERRDRDMLKNTFRAIERLRDRVKAELTADVF